jgi:hypothetical protein
MTKFDKWKKEMTVERAKKINESIEGVAFDDEFERIPTNEDELNIWRERNNLSAVRYLFENSDCEFCPADEDGCPDIDDCEGAFLGWAEESL